VVASPEDALYINLNRKRKKEVDLDNLHKIGLIKEIIYDDSSNMFYLLSNKYQGLLGFFVLKFPEDDCHDVTYLMRYLNKLDIDDTNIYINNRSKDSRELVISFKTIFINTFTIFVLDITSDEAKTLLYRHESFQLWESDIQGVLLERSKEFISINKDGIHVLSLDSKHMRPVFDGTGRERMLHSLEAMSFLKVSSENFINFAS
jgi:hypothetical protein